MTGAKKKTQEQPVRPIEEMMRKVSSRIKAGDSFLRMPEVYAKVGLSRSTIKRRIAAGAFPESITLGQNSVGWLNSDIEAWMDKTVADAGRGDSNERSE